jgi:hypothetical protein
MEVILAVVFLWTGAFKLWSRKAPLAAAGSGLGRIVGADRVVVTYRALGAAELAAAAALLVTAIPVVLLCSGFLAYLGYTKLATPSASCGCGSAQTRPIGWRNFAFTGSLLGISLAVAAGVNAVWPVVVALAAAVALVNPELDRFWLMPLRRLRVRLTHPLRAMESDDVPLLATVQQLHRSEVYRTIGAMLRSDVVESWDEGEWRILRYTLTYQDRPADAIFAVPRTVDEPHRVRLAIVASQTD